MANENKKRRPQWKKQGKCQFLLYNHSRIMVKLLRIHGIFLDIKYLFQSLEPQYFCFFTNDRWRRVLIMQEIIF